MCELVIASINFSALKQVARKVSTFAIYVVGALVVALIMYVCVHFDIFFSSQVEQNLVNKLFSGSGNLAVNPATALE